MTGAGGFWAELQAAGLVETLEQWRDLDWRPTVAESEREPVLCGECSPDMGVWFDEWPDALADIPDHDRIRCERCQA